MSVSLAYTDKHLKPLPIRASSHHQDPLLYIDRQTKHIERNLQVLIDAQSEGLLAGLSGQQQNDTPSLSDSKVTVPVRQPAPKKIGLRVAREGIFKSIYDLLKLREEERELLGFRDGERKDALVEIDEFSSKRFGLEEAISSIRSNRDSQRSTDLKDEARTLESEIRELETRLYEMKAKHRHVIQEISEIENSVDSKLSSYNASLSLVETNIRKYLQNPPLQPLSPTADEPTFYSLHPKRRTLDMVREHWKAEQERLHKRQSEVDAEIQALEAGGGVWKQVVTEVTGFEKRLRSEMRRSIQTQSQVLEADGPSGSKTEDSRVQTIIDDLQATTQRVEGQLEIAEDRDWKLLMCCIGAEVEALREAREMLLEVFNVQESPENKESDPDNHDHHDDAPTDPLGVDNPEPPEDLLRDTGDHRHDTTDEDDEPDPAWLLPES
ncbi:uncharacterized protein ASPGLDRAFT_78462 [Aspergillus glaucus CBS 516.65]|uniref:Autophagy-related protein Atg28 n=1 Tax=Aspergillus glaucus CBS 516.65 TaxID=1160497 RepID=A0A1L9VZB6_ASPGL|nr:hypothetical protein ASPGLDRAFT_78462 [Aspergillus glaucus CBS 516.65]OJJ89252.1 hypothetical protein ASPGLDRAFT_78462 [Aspergillus glaucus CBS 516.65]